MPIPLKTIRQQENPVIYGTKRSFCPIFRTPHHKVKDFQTQADVFRRLCGAEAQLNDPNAAFRRIDRVLEHVSRYKRPGYIELPRDLVDVVPESPYVPSLRPATSDPEVLAEAVAEAAGRIAAARCPVIIADVEIHRFGLQEKLLALAEEAGIPMVSTILGKSVVSERHPLFAGLYEGAMGREEVTQFVESSDCVILLGHIYDRHQSRHLHGQT